MSPVRILEVNDMEKFIAVRSPTTVIIPCEENCGVHDRVGKYGNMGKGYMNCPYYSYIPKAQGIVPQSCMLTIIATAIGRNGGFQSSNQPKKQQSS